MKPEHEKAYLELAAILRNATGGEIVMNGVAKDAAEAVEYLVGRVRELEEEHEPSTPHSNQVRDLIMRAEAAERIVRAITVHVESGSSLSWRMQRIKAALDNEAVDYLLELK